MINLNKNIFTENRKQEHLELKFKREGKIYFNKYNEKILILEYNGYHDVKIRFENGFKRKVNWNEIENKTCINPYTPTVCNMGYLGEGKYNPKEHRKIYKLWKAMIERCYKENNKDLTYRDCNVENYLLNFQNYAQWYEENYYECNGEEMEIDKDILEKNNKTYDREHMIFVPKRINQLIGKRQNLRGKYPIGIYERNGKLVAQCSILDNGKKKKKHLGYFPLNKPFQAFTSYKNFKEDYVKKVADEYKELIPKKLYDALYNYKVEVND